MQLHVLFLLVSFMTSGNFCVEKEPDQVYTKVYHYQNNISLNNFDGTTSNILLNGNSATLYNADGTQSTINFCNNSSTLIAADGTSSTIFHSGFSSTVSISDGTRVNINHMQRSSSCTTANGKHRIMHTFSNVKDKRYKDKIDVLIHINWLTQNKALLSTD